MAHLTLQSRRSAIVVADRRHPEPATQDRMARAARLREVAADRSPAAAWPTRDARAHAARVHAAAHSAMPSRGASGDPSPPDGLSARGRAALRLRRFGPAGAHDGRDAGHAESRRGVAAEHAARRCRDGRTRPMTPSAHSVSIGAGRCRTTCSASFRLLGTGPLDRGRRQAGREHRLHLLHDRAAGKPLTLAFQISSCRPPTQVFQALGEEAGTRATVAARSASIIRSR